MPKVSVLIAVYNAEKYLCQCLDSLSHQTLQDFEVLCVDDASTDSSLSILNEYAEKDDRFKVFHLQQNSGPCKARNVALSHSTGEYVCFLDADDWMDTDTLEKTVKVFQDNKETDVVLFHCVFSYADGRQEDYPMQPFERKSCEEAFVDSLTWKIHGIYMINGDLHRKYPYDESGNAYNDENVTRVHFLKAKEVRYSEGRYYYRQHSESVTHVVSTKKFDYLKTCEEMKQRLFSLQVNDDIITAYENQRWLVFIDCYMYYFKHKSVFSKVERQEVMDELKRIWNGMELDRLLTSTTRKFGYMPLRCSWRLFRMQEDLYFFLRRIMNRL